MPDDEIIVTIGEWNKMQIKISELEKKISTAAKDWNLHNERIEKLEDENQKRDTETSKLMEKYGEMFEELSELKASSASHTEKIKKLNKGLDKCFGDFQDDDNILTNQITELKEQMRIQNEFDVNFARSFENTKKALQDILYVGIEGPNHMNESCEENAYARILAKLNGGDSKKAWEFAEKVIKEKNASKPPSRLCEFPNCDEFGTKRHNGRFLCEQHYIKEKPPEQDAGSARQTDAEIYSYRTLHKGGYFKDHEPDKYTLVEKADLEYIFETNPYPFGSDKSLKWNRIKKKISHGGG